MQFQNLPAIAASVAGGAVMAALSLLLFGRLPVVPLAGQYLSFQSMLFFAFAGQVVALVVVGRTAYGRLVGLYVGSATLVLVAGLVVLGHTPFILWPSLVVGVLATVATVAFCRRSGVSTRIVRLLALESAALFVFVVIFLIASFAEKGSATVFTPGILLVLFYAVFTGVLKREQAAI